MWLRGLRRLGGREAVCKGRLTVLVHDDESRAQELVLCCLVALGHAGVEDFVQLLHFREPAMVQLISWVVSMEHGKLNSMLLHVSKHRPEVGDVQSVTERRDSGNTGPLGRGCSPQNRARK